MNSPLYHENRSESMCRLDSYTKKSKSHSLYLALREMRRKRSQKNVELTRDRQRRLHAHGYVVRPGQRRTGDGQRRE